MVSNWCSWSHSIQNREPRVENPGAQQLPSFYLVHGQSPLNGPAHITGGFPFLTYPSLKHLSQTCPEHCLLSESMTSLPLILTSHTARRKSVTNQQNLIGKYHHQQKLDHESLDVEFGRSRLNVTIVFFFFWSKFTPSIAHFPVYIFFFSSLAMVHIQTRRSTQLV